MARMMAMQKAERRVFIREIREIRGPFPSVAAGRAGILCGYFLSLPGVQSPRPRRSPFICRLPCGGSGFFFPFARFLSSFSETRLDKN
jgi:hypothetical protein